MLEPGATQQQQAMFYYECLTALQATSLQRTGDCLTLKNVLNKTYALQTKTSRLHDCLGIAFGGHLLRLAMNTFPCYTLTLIVSGVFFSSLLLSLFLSLAGSAAPLSLFYLRWF